MITHYSLFKKAKQESEVKYLYLKELCDLLLFDIPKDIVSIIVANILFSTLNLLEENNARRLEISKLILLEKNTVELLRIAKDYKEHALLILKEPAFYAKFERVGVLPTNLYDKKMSLKEIALTHSETQEYVLANKDDFTGLISDYDIKDMQDKYYKDNNITPHMKLNGCMR